MTTHERQRAPAADPPAHGLPAPRVAADGLSDRTRWQTPDAVVVEVTGEIDVCTVARLEATLDDHLRAGPGVLRLDLGEVRFLGAAGLGVLMRARERAAALGIHLVLDAGRSHAAARALELLDRLRA
ncbi:anti-anti-sigma factor [Amycolatopsis lexingtonensis]|uniref:Anti-anti-sigma factor n=1 Tax=Amycolatopsis lexingtonensis TaxID=218822 RepID=A0ABR9HS64_9PSEU|nr:STAS domain-containing protein [Amycolatopsis lexingtonensis]MBE1493769.1 anti-anti-sigma factor [Amycolatopsis lexingtonensis]